MTRSTQHVAIQYHHPTTHLSSLPPSLPSCNKQICVPACAAAYDKLIADGLAYIRECRSQEEKETKKASTSTTISSSSHHRHLLSSSLLPYPPLPTTIRAVEEEGHKEEGEKEDDDPSCSIGDGLCERLQGAILWRPEGCHSRGVAH